MILHGTDPQSLFSMTGRQSAIHAHGYWASERSSTDKRVSLVRKQPVHTDPSSRGDVDFAVGYRWGYEFHGIARAVPIVHRHRAIPVFHGEISRIVGMQDRRPRTGSGHGHNSAVDSDVRVGVAVLAGVNGPHNAMRRSLRRDRWSGAGKVEGLRGERGDRRVEQFRGRIEGELFQRIAISADI